MTVKIFLFALKNKNSAKKKKHYHSKAEIFRAEEALNFLGLFLERIFFLKKNYPNKLPEIFSCRIPFSGMIS
jgi:hypothetical protein